MVAPIQGGNDYNSSSDFLVELNSFYNDPSNDGVKSDFVAPNGQSFSISSKSDLSLAQGDFNKGEIFEGADLDTSAEKRAEKKEAQKKKNAKSKNNDSAKGPSESEKSGAVSKGKDAISSGKEAKKQAKEAQKGPTEEGVKMTPNDAGSTGKAKVEQGKAKTAAVGNKVKDTKAQTKSNKEETASSQKEIAASKKASDKKLQGLDKKNKITMKKIKTSQNKITKLIAAADKKVAAASNAPAPTEAKGQTSGMGFGGKLGSASYSGGGATDKAWANTVNGKSKSLEKLSKGVGKQSIELLNVTAAGKKAKIPFDKSSANFINQSSGLIAQSELSTENAEATHMQSTISHTMASGSYVAAAASGTDAVINFDKAPPKITASTTENTTGVALVAAPSPDPVTKSTGIRMIVKGVLGIADGAHTVGKGITSSVKCLTSAANGVLKTLLATEQRSQAFDFEATSREQLAASKDMKGEAALAKVEGKKAYVRAVKATQKKNSELLKSAAAMNTMAQNLASSLSGGGSGLSNSSILAIDPSGMNEDQMQGAIADREQEIMDHEMSHASIIGGSPVIEYDANGMPVGGYVEVDDPSLDESDIEGSIERAELLIQAALAPTNPSSQDNAMASAAQDVLSQAQAMLEEKANKIAEEEGTDSEDVKEGTDEQDATEVMDKANEEQVSPDDIVAKKDENTEEKEEVKEDKEKLEEVK